MDTDRELLELAAKAAGISFDEEEKSKFGLWVLYGIEPSEYTRRRWNPLVNDGDALRLAVKLGIGLEFAGVFAVAYAGSRHAPQFTERFNGYPDAATRRAIVRAAAEIGRDMPATPPPG